jgi:PilZ domain
MNSTVAARSSPMPVDDRRRHKRFRLCVPVSISGHDASIIPAMTLEISEKGLSAVLVSDLRIGDLVIVYPVAGETLTAQVRHNVGRVYGFEFLNVSEEQVGRLRDVCGKLPRYPHDNKMGI